MHKTILQVPIDKNLKSTAERAAARQGFSSLQEVVRVFLMQLATEKVAVTLQEARPLSPANEKRYSTMTKNFETGKNVSTAKNAADLIAQLNDN